MLSPGFAFNAGLLVGESWQAGSQGMTSLIFSSEVCGDVQGWCCPAHTNVPLQKQSL